MKAQRILLTGGGSGGHIIPNLAVASLILDKNPKAKLLYVASRKNLDRELLRNCGMPVKRIFSGKLRRYFSWRHFLDPLLVILGFIQACFIILVFRPQVIFSKGGYVSLPVVFAGFILRRKIILHESDSRMGLSNRLSAKMASQVCVAFPELEKLGKKYVLTGNPIRPEIADGDKERGYKITNFTDKLPVMLVYGGSQGAKQINQLIEHDFDKLTKHFQIIHITGKGKEIKKANNHYVHFEYLKEELKDIYAITDIIVGRAGANSLYEIAYLKKPNVLIPLGNADQLNNAKFFESEKASVVFKTGDELFDLVTNLWQNTALKEDMSKALKKLSRPHATEDIAKLILEL